MKFSNIRLDKGQSHRRSDQIACQSVEDCIEITQCGPPDGGHDRLGWEDPGFACNNVFSRSMKCSSLRRMVGKLGTMALRKLGKCPSRPPENRTLPRVKPREKERSQLQRNSAPSQRWAKRERERKWKDKSRYPKLSYDRFQLISLNCIFGVSKFCWIGKEMEQ